MIAVATYRVKYVLRALVSRETYRREKFLLQTKCTYFIFLPLI